jgi:hypothetical protein
MAKRAKSKRPHEHCKQYLLMRKRIKNKVRRTTAKYNYTVAHRQEQNKLGVIKKPLKELEYFIDKIGRTKEK